MESYRLDAGLGIAEKVALLFQPDTILPAQYWQTFRRKAHLEPERTLALAILKDSITSFQKHLCARDRRGKMLFREAEDWILDEDWDSVFSFNNVCEVLGLEPSYIRDRLRQWKEKELSVGLKSKIHPLAVKGSRRKHRGHNGDGEIGWNESPGGHFSRRG